MLRTCSAWILAVSLLVLAASAAGQGAPAPDRATFQISVHDQPIGYELIQIENSTDSLRVASSSVQMLGRAHTDSLIKQTKVIATIEDLDLRAYASSTRFMGDILERGVECEDTLLHLSSVTNHRGDQVIVPRPPGRLFVIDAGSFVSFNLICRMLRGRAFVTRPVNMLILGPRDTVVTATVEDGGTETLKWGTGPVTARRVTLTDRDSRYVMWMDATGRMLRLENAWSGVRVERKPPPARTTKAKPKPTS